MSLHKEPTTKIEVGSGYSDEFSVKVGVIIVLFVTVIDEIMEGVRKSLFHEILHAENLVLMRDSIENI